MIRVIFTRVLIIIIVPKNAAAKTAILDVKNSCRFARDSFRVKSFNLWCPQNMSKT